MTANANAVAETTSAHAAAAATALAAGDDNNIEIIEDPITRPAVQSTFSIAENPNSTNKPASSKM